MLSRPRARRLSAAAALLAVLTPAAARAREAREEARREFARTVALRGGQSFRLEHEQGDVVIRTHALAEARIAAHIRVSAPSAAEADAAAQQVAIQVTETPAGVAVRTQYPQARGRNLSYAVDYDITLPETTPLQARNSFGSFTLNGLKADGDVRNSHGRLSFADGKGRQRLENSFGAVDVARNEGDVTVVNQNGAVKVEDVQGALEVTNRFGRVEVQRVRGAATVTNGNGAVLLAEAGGPSRISNSFGAVEATAVRGDLAVNNGNGTITVRNVSGAADLRTSFGALTFEDVGKLVAVNNNGRVTGSRVGGAADVRTSFGAVELSQVQGDAVVANSNASVTLREVTGAVDVRTTFGRIEVSGARKGVRAVGGNGQVAVSDVGPAYLKTTFGLVQADRVDGSLEVDNSNGAVRASAIKGAVTVRTSFGAVVLTGVEGQTVDVHNQNGAVEVEARAQPCARITLATSYGPLRLRLPAGGGYDVTARTSYSRIQSELPITASGSIGGDSLGGRIGAGGCVVSLTGSNGSIDILKAGP
jgi:DUF4097 and DUF4098 domain-containing protein YvlB